MVGDFFEITVQLKISSGSPVVRGIIRASTIQTPQISNLNSSLFNKVKNMLYRFSEGSNSSTFLNNKLN